MISGGWAETGVGMSNRARLPILDNKLVEVWRCAGFGGLFLGSGLVR